MVLAHRAGEVVGDALEVEFLGSLEKVANVFVQLALILLHRQQIVGLNLYDLPGDLLLAAHGVDGDDASGEIQHVQQLGGIAVISLDFSSTLVWPSAKPLDEAHTLTMWMAPLPRVRSWERRTVLPSMATTSPWVSWATA